MTQLPAPAEETNGQRPWGPSEGYASTNPLPRDFEPNFTMPDEGKDSGGEHTGSYSHFLHIQYQILNKLYGVVMRGRIKDERHALLIHMLFVVFEDEWMSDVCNRKARQRAAQEDADSWQGRMGTEPLPTRADGAEIPGADDLLLLWNTGRSLELEFTIQKRLHGLDYVERQYGRMADPQGAQGAPADAREALERAREDMARARFLAAQLPPSHAEYFWAKVTWHEVSNERKFDLALGRRVQDYAEVFGSMMDGDILRRHWEIQMTKMYPWEQQPPAPQRKWLQFIRGGGGADEDPGHDDNGRGKEE